MLHLHTTGNPENEMILFLHGAGIIGGMWHRQLASLSSQYYCIAPDLPGHGKSNHVPYESLSQVAALICDVIRTKSPNSKAHIVGLSLGGYIALTLLAQFPESVQDAIVSGITARPLPTTVKLQTHIAGWLFPVMKTNWMLRMQAKALKMESEDFEHLAEGWRTFSRQAFGNIMKEVNHYQLPALLATNSHPVLAVAGENEIDLIRESLHDMTEAIPGARGSIVPEVGHSWVAEKPALFTEMVHLWVKEHDVPTVMRAIV